MVTRKQDLIFDSCARLGESTPLEVIEVSGTDAEDFLQRLVSCDLRKVEEGVGSRCTLLDGKGRILAFFDIHRHDQRFLIVVEGEMTSRLVNQLERLVILEDVQLDRHCRKVISIQGPTSRQLLDTLGAPNPEGFLRSLRWQEGWIVDRPRSPVSGFDVMISSEDCHEMLETLEAAGVEECSAEDADRARIVAGFPGFGREIVERSLPPEVGLDDAISYDKGCYAGQEVLARIRTYGRVNRQLRRMRVAIGVDPEKLQMEVGDDLLATDGDHKAVASITSFAALNGANSSETTDLTILASVKKTHVEVGTSLIWRGQQTDGEPLTIEVETELPFTP